jgi:hypothetical protein
MRAVAQIMKAKRVWRVGLLQDELKIPSEIARLDRRSYTGSEDQPLVAPLLTGEQSFFHLLTAVFA